MTDLHVDAPAWLESEREHEEIGLARAESLVQTALSTSVVDLLGATITVDVPHELDVWVVGRVPYLGCVRRGATATIYLTDATGQVTDAAGITTSRRHGFGFVLIDELIPAGSGTVTRKLRGQTTKGSGFANLGGAGRVTLDAYIR